MKHISLFSGIGGFDLAAEWHGWENIAHCEINKFGQRVLKYYWPNAISYEDITKTDFTIHRGCVDILTGGFPCQGFSIAGQRLGTDDDRYLWPEYLRVIDETEPTWVVGENVTGILSMADKSGIYKEVFAKVEGRRITRFPTTDYYEAVYTQQERMLVASICESLETRGYEVQTFAIPAASVGAPHQRERIWFVAYSSKSRCNGGSGKKSNINAHNPTIGRNLLGETTGFSRKRNVTNSESPGLSECRPKSKQQKTTEKQRTKHYSNKANWSEWPTQSPICSGNDGLPNRLDRITFPKWRTESIMGAGNAIVPQVAYEIFEAIKNYDA